MPWLSPEGPCLTDTEADANNQLLDWAWGPPMEELEDGPEELKGFTAS